jgi:hypothetical protein
MSKFALVTCSYAPDYERCRLLVESVQQFSQLPLKHYLIVDKRDAALFSTLASPDTEIVTVESLLPRWICRVPGIKKAWFSFKTLPVRNWIAQQLVKISFAQNASEPIIVFADSDVAFIRPFNLSSFCQQDKIRLFRVPEYYSKGFEPWYQSAYQLLGISGYRYGVSRPNFVGNLITWRRENVQAMCDRIEQNSGKSWQETLAGTLAFSEYVLYGTFVDQVLGESAQHFYDWSPLCHEYWEDKKMSDQQLEAFFDSIQPENIAVMISSKAGIDPHRYAHHIQLHRDPTTTAIS